MNGTHLTELSLAPPLSSSLPFFLFSCCVVVCVTLLLFEDEEVDGSIRGGGKSGDTLGASFLRI